MSRHHESATMLAAMLQMNHDEIFLHWEDNLTELQRRKSNETLGGYNIISFFSKSITERDLLYALAGDPLRH